MEKHKAKIWNVPPDEHLTYFSMKKLEQAYLNCGKHPLDPLDSSRFYGFMEAVKVLIGIKASSKFFVRMEEEIRKPKTQE